LENYERWTYTCSPSNQKEKINIMLRINKISIIFIALGLFLGHLLPSAFGIPVPMEQIFDRSFFQCIALFMVWMMSENE
jgi:hypothetical protein